MFQLVRVVACSSIMCKLSLLPVLLVYLDVDFEKDIVLCEVPFGGVLFINNLVPHRRFAFLFFVVFFINQFPRSFLFLMD